MDHPLYIEYEVLKLEKLCFEELQTACTTALALNTSITMLNVSSNPLTDKGAAQLARNHTLEQLSIVCNLYRLRRCESAGPQHVYHVSRSIFRRTERRRGTRSRLVMVVLLANASHLGNDVCQQNAAKVSDLNVIFTHSSMFTWHLILFMQYKHGLKSTILFNSYKALLSPSPTSLPPENIYIGPERPPTLFACR